MTMKCNLCGRYVPDLNIAVLNISIEDLTTNAEVGNELTFTVCYDCVPMLVAGIKDSIAKAADQARSDLIGTLVSGGEY